ncbi:hypothetical protein [Persicobacter psychrovividus]|uniref:Uncharacterized protein n=1 Tax=Persicobacter psychrovividus TaxID=387638 RepID=A0ABM7VK32_9BACT|nr:hypothetical protein PEPS_36280 [Persicobacter psychrovividus]
MIEIKQLNINIKLKSERSNGKKEHQAIVDLPIKDIVRESTRQVLKEIQKKKIR